MAITVADKKLWERAIEKCKAEKPRVKALAEFGSYEVCGHSGCYIVTWSGKGQEMKATCSCPAGKKNKPCYHVPATSGAFKLAVQTRAQARLFTQDCPKCGTEFQTENSAAFFCPTCEEADRRAKVEKDFSDLFGNLPVLTRLKEVE